MFKTDAVLVGGETMQKLRKVPLENDEEFLRIKLEGTEKERLKGWKGKIKEEDWKIIKEDAFYILLNITPRCNSNCKICFMSEENFKEMSLEDLKFILSKIGRNKSIVLFGKEPTLHPMLFEFIDEIEKSGNYPDLYTNGLKLEDENFVRKLKKVRRLYFSFNGFTEEIHERIHGDSNQLYKKLKALKNLKKHRIPTIIAFTLVDGINNDQLRLILKFGMNNEDFVKGFHFYGATPYGRFNVSMERYLTSSDLILLLEEASNGEIRMEYFAEFKRLKANIYRLMHMLGLSFPIPLLNAPYRVIRHSPPHLAEYIPVEDLKTINESLEKKKYWKLLKYWRYLFRIINPIKSYYDTFKENIIWINVGNINTPVNHLPIRHDTLAIQKNPLKGFTRIVMLLE